MERYKWHMTSFVLPTLIRRSERYPSECIERAITFFAKLFQVKREDKSTSRDVSLTAVPRLPREFPFTYGGELMERIHERLKPEGKTTVRDSSRRSFILLLLKYESLRRNKRTLRSGPFFRADVKIDEIRDVCDSRREMNPFDYDIQGV